MVLTLLSAYLIGLAVSSLTWHMNQDSPILLYAAFLIDRLHVVPYRDLFDMNMPGAYGANILVGRIFGYTEPAFRRADLLVLCVMLATTFTLMRRFGRLVAWCATVFFGVLYLASGPVMSLQREFLLLLPVAAAVAIAVTGRVGVQAKSWAVGLLVGVAATIKPHAALALPVLVAWLSVDASAATGTRRRVGPVAARAVLGFAFPVFVMLTYLWEAGAFPGFIDMAENYWPLYASLSGARPHHVLTGVERLWYVCSRIAIFGLHPGLPLAVAAVAGAWVALRRSTLGLEARRVVWLLVGMAGCFVVYVAMAGKFWPYHWLPFNYFGVLLGSLGLVERSPGSRAPRGLVAVTMTLLIIALPWPIGPFARRIDLPFDKVKEISSFLEQQLAPGDTVQPLDWTGGAVHAMLLAQARPATRFVYDFHFYHHVSHPYIQRLREQFMADLGQARPAVIIRVARRARLAGPDTSEDFDALTRYLSTNYARTVEGDGYEIWTRRGAVGEPGTARPRKEDSP